MNKKLYILLILGGLMVITRPFPLKAENSLRLESAFHAPFNKTEKANASIPLSLRPIVDAEAAPIGERLKAVHNLHENLRPDEVVLLCGFLESLPAHKEHNLAGLQVVKNDILNVLRNQIVAPEGLTDVLISMYNNKYQDATTRDYAVQHLISWHERDDQTLKVKETIQKVLWEAVMEKNSIAGTALLGLHRISTEEPSLDFQRVSQQAQSLVQSDGTELAVRITAVQICGERDLQETMPTIKALASHSDSIAMQLSAIAAIGYMGGSDEIQFLRDLQTQANGPIEVGIIEALKRITKRQIYFEVNRKQL